MTTLQRVQDAARIAAQYVGGPARVAFKAFEDALEVEIEREERERKLASRKAERDQPQGHNL